MVYMRDYHEISDIFHWFRITKNLKLSNLNAKTKFLINGLFKLYLNRQVFLQFAVKSVQISDFI